jgi:hypothetical protein
LKEFYSKNYKNNSNNSIIINENQDAPLYNEASIAVTFFGESQKNSKKRILNEDHTKSPNKTPKN